MKTIKEDQKSFSRSARKRGAPMIYLFIVLFLAVLFFSNDFGLVDIQKTAIVLAVGVDRENDEFIVNSLIAVPSASGDQKSATESVQVQTRGITVGAAIQEINTKTGWYPKLVFLNLIVLGKTAVEKNAFETLDYFLRNEYMSDDCKLCCCEKNAGELLRTQTSVEKIPALAIDKILSDHSEKTGLAAVSSLRDFSKGYFSSAKSGFMPLLKTTSLSDSARESSGTENLQKNSGNSGNSAQTQNSEKSGEESSGGEVKKETFSATETALFHSGIYRGKLTKEETFAFLCVKGGVRLASFNVEYGGVNYTLTIKKSDAKIKFSVDDFATPRLNVDLNFAAGLQDASNSQKIVEIAAPEKTKEGILLAAGKKMEALVKSVFEKSKAHGCDLFQAEKRLQKYESAYYSAYRETVLERLLFHATAHFSSAR